MEVRDEEEGAVDVWFTLVPHQQPPPVTVKTPFDSTSRKPVCYISGCTFQTVTRIPV